MVKVKICGITNLQDGLDAIQLGADCLGFNFHKKSPRYIEPAKAKLIIESLPPIVSLIGIFVDEFSPERLMTISHAVGISTVQLHGAESPEYVRKLSGLRVIKSFQVNEKFDLKRMEAYGGSAFLLDAYDGISPGGTGKTFNWEVAIAAKKYGCIILAGGLNAANVHQAIQTVDPYAVDVCSGVESEPGKKDFEKMKLLFNKIRRTHLEELGHPPAQQKEAG